MQPTASTENGTFVVTAAQAERIAVVVAFLHAYNTGQADRALALFADAPVVSDCDYRAVKAVNFVGRSQVTRWLRARIADHDHLALRRIWNRNPDDQPVVAVDYDRRTSDLLRALGFPNGIRPALTSKVTFTPDHRILRFANGPSGGPPNSAARSDDT